MKAKRNSKKQILSNIMSNGGFDNYNKWDWMEVADWVQSQFNCSRKLAETVALEIK